VKDERFTQEGISSPIRGAVETSDEVPKHKVRSGTEQRVGNFGEKLGKSEHLFAICFRGGFTEKYHSCHDKRGFDLGDNL
jgi:hypothetical protein